MRDTAIYYHGTKATLAPGDLIVAGYASNFGKRRNAKYVYLTAMLEAATWRRSTPIRSAMNRRLRCAISAV